MFPKTWKIDITVEDVLQEEVMRAFLTGFRQYLGSRGRMLYTGCVIEEEGKKDAA
jgi:hypothetical protein